MARIGKISFWTDQIKFDSTITYNSTRYDGSFFAVPIPDLYLQLSEHSEWVPKFKTLRIRGKDVRMVFAKTEQEVRNTFEEYMKAYMAMNITEEKVIIYTFNGNSAYRDQTNSKRKKKRDRIYSKYSFEQPVIVSFDYHVAMKKTISDVNSYFLIQEGEVSETKIDVQLKNKISDGDHVCIPYTIEAERFFSDLYDATDALTDKFLKYIGDTKKIKFSIENYPATKLLK